MTAKGERPETFFRQTFFTFNHAETVQAVSEQVADGGAVDSYIWEYLAIF
ncbi:ABC transporter substrate-binding protein, partial [Candidatus Endoriftia persephone str. Guaymas]|nr:ABC transporter substrate-binding protein [Candidatus Endoriftia persephone str. Guaymas]